MAKKSDNDIRNLTEDWALDDRNGLPYSGRAVQKIIKDYLQGHEIGKVGFQKIVTGADGVSNVLISFASEDKYDLWLALPEEQRWSTEGQSLMITWNTLPSIDIGDTYFVNLLYENVQQLQPDTNVSVSLKGISTVTHAAGGTENINELLTIEVLTRTSTTASWQNAGSFTLLANLDEWTSISLAPYLTTGMNYVRMKARGEFAEGLVWRNLIINVVGLRLVSNTATYIPVSGNLLQLNYLVAGAIDKTLRLEFGHGIGSSFEADWSYIDCDKCNIPVNGTNTSTGFTYEFAPSQRDLTDILTDGLHTVRAQLYVNDSVQTEWVEVEYMVVQDQVTSSPVVVINNTNTVVDNYTNVKFFNWAVSKNIVVRFRLTDETETVTYSTWEYEGSAETLYELSTQLTINNDRSSIYAYMHIEDGTGYELHPPLFITIVNNREYMPTSGPEFVFQPSNRSNDETNPRTIINAVDDSIIPSTGWETLGMTNSDGYIDGSLVIPAGNQINVGYNPLRTLANPNSNPTGLTAKNMTFEVDFTVTNITDDTKPVIRIGNYLNTETDKDIWGIEILPTEAAILTARNRVRDDQNVAWAESIRTRLTFNVVYGLNPDNNPDGTKLNYIRIFVNDTIEREIEYGVGDRFVGSENAQLIFGSTGADIAIHGIRCYTKALSTAEVQKDYLASLGSVEEKAAWKTKNDILGDDELIDFEKAKNAGYNVIGHTGPLLKYGVEKDTSLTGITLTIHIHNDEAHSGTLTNLENKGQGTTAMNYYDWNQQYKITDNTIFTPEDGSASEQGSGYAIQEGEAYAKKLVGKINFASSMQGHKMGLTKIYDEVFKDLVSNGYIDKPSQITKQPSARIAVLEKPFLFFQRDTEDDNWTFRYLMTFGAGKGDKPTFGFNKTTTPSYMMVEGADNDKVLAMFMSPWNDEVNYDAGKEAWYIGNDKNINFGFGVTSKTGGQEYPSDAAALNKIKDFWNFVYLHTRNISYFDGTLSLLKDGEQRAEGNLTPSLKMLYWTTQPDSTEGASIYDLFRYDTLTGTWVNAGIDLNVLNLLTQYEEMCFDMGQLSATWTAGQWGIINDKVINVRTNHFKYKASDYIHVDDALYHSAFVKFFAGTDNRAKNTYYYTDPDTLKIRHQQDDVDTTIKTNNIGQQRKPYYVEEHDKNDKGEYYWQGESNSYYNLLETAFSEELVTMMNNMLTAMNRLGGSTKNYLISRVLEAQDYFPAVAYNETARLVYERASIALHDGIYVNSDVMAITQSNGTQRWSEYQWLVDRLMYISSWCNYGEFAAGTGTAGALTFRGAEGNYAFTLTPAKWLYPKVAQGSSLIDPSRGENRVRVQAGQPFNYQNFYNDGDSTISIKGVGYYSEIGDMNVPTSPSLQTLFLFFGDRLRRITINPNGSDDNVFRSQSLSTTATNITEITVRNVDTLQGDVDLSQCVRLTKIDFRGSTPGNITLPETSSLTELHLPSSLTELRVKNCPNINTFSIAGVNNIDTLYIENAGAIDALAIVNQMYNAHANDSSYVPHVTIKNIDANIVSNDGLKVLIWLAGFENVALTGRINIADGVTFDFMNKYVLTKRFGNVDDSNNVLHITYTYSVSPGLTLEPFCNGIADIVMSTGEYQFMPIPFVSDAIQMNVNYVSTVEWSISSNAYATMNSDGKLTVTSIGQYETATANISLRGTLIDGTIVETIFPIYFFNREATLGDYVYPDGTYSKTWLKAKTIIGIIVFDSNGIKEMCSLHINGSDMWGVTSFDVIEGVARKNTPLFNWNEGLSTELSVSLADANYFNVNNDDFVAFPNDKARGRFTYSPSEDEEFAISSDERIVFKKGRIYPIGQYNTAVIIYWRNALLSSVDLEIPHESVNETEQEALLRLETKIAQDNNNSSYKQYYYPAFSNAFSYIPAIHNYEKLDDKFSIHNWYLGGIGVMGRISAYYKNRETFMENSKHNVFYNVNNVMQYHPELNLNINNANCWSSDEANGHSDANGIASAAWSISSTGNIFSPGWNSPSKGHIKDIRPICRFS